jgi:hypothetical protein
VLDPSQDLLVTAGTYLLSGAVTSGRAPITVAVTVGGQTYTAPVTGGAFQLSLTLASLQASPVQVTATDASSVSASLFRTLVQVSSTDAAAFTMPDALRALEIANGLVPSTADDLALYDLAPRVNGVSQEDGAISLEDALVILWLASGQSL